MGGKQVWEECARLPDSKQNSGAFVLGVSAVNVALKQLQPFFFFFSAEAETVFFLSLRPLYVTVVYQGKYSHCMRIGVAVPLNSTVYRLRDAVSRETKIPMDQVLFPSLSDSAPDTLWGCVTAAQCYCRTPVYPGGAACNPFPPPDKQSHNETCFNTLKLRCSNFSVLLTGAENVSH